MHPKLLLLGAVGALGAAIPLPSATLNGNQVLTGVIEQNVEAFRGVPFADPPLGDLRLRYPTNFTGSYQGLQALTYKGACMQIDPLKVVTALERGANALAGIPAFLRNPLFQTFKGSVDTSEDCLYLNVLRPLGTSAEDKLPVLVWVHGGAFLWGSSATYPGEHFVRDSVKMNQPVVFVSITYRAGPFGFLGGENVKNLGLANIGLMDQRKGLEWIQDNIANFGGDPDRVTLFSESAGAMAVATQLVLYDGDHTYNGKPLYHAAIMQSGGPLPFADMTSLRPQVEYDRFLQLTGCQKFKGEAAIDCLRTRPLDILVGAFNSYPVDEIFGILEMFLAYSPRPDGKILTGDPYTLYKQNKVAPVPIITGNMEDDGTVFALMTLNTTNSAGTRKWLEFFMFDAPKDKIDELMRLYPEDPVVGSPYRTGLSNQINSQYKRMASLMTDVLFFAPRRIIIENSKQKIFTYVSTALHNLVPYLGTFHAVDVVFQFYLDIGPSHPFRKYWIAFTNHLDPNVGSGLPQWDEYNNDNKNMLEITFRNQFMRKDDYRTQEIEYCATEPSLRL